MQSSQKLSLTGTARRHGPTGKTETVRRHARDSIDKDGGMISVEW